MFKIKIKQLICGILIFPLFYTVVHAKGANGLYSAVAPSNSAFIRVVNLSETLITVDVLGKNNKQNVASQSVGGYLFTPSGTVNAVIGGIKFKQNMKEKEVKTLVLKDNKIIVIDDNYFNSKRKSRVSFFNLSTQHLSLKTHDSKHQLIAPISPNASATRKLNEVKIKLAVFDDVNKLGDFSEQLFKKGRSYSFIVYGNGTKINMLTVPDAIDPIL